MERVIQFRVHKGVFDQGLTVVERTCHLDGSDVSAQGSELAFLDRTDLPLGIEYVHMNARNPQKAVRDGTPGVTGSGHEHIERFA